MPNPFADILLQAAQLNRNDPRRQGNTVRLHDDGDILIAGDFHGHRHNLNKTIDFADLPNHPSRILVLQEVIHGPGDPASGHDRSVDLLVRVARLKIAHPQQVLFVMGNHDVAQLTGNEIAKEGRGVCKAFLAGVEFTFGPAAQEVLPAINEFIRSLPLAVITPNRVMICHSLPSPNRMELIDFGLLDRPDYSDADLRRGGTAYEWTWGRNQNPDQMEALATKLDIEFFVVGHRHSGEGFEMIPHRGLSIASDHAKGYIMLFAFAERLGVENVERFLRPITTLE